MFKTILSQKYDKTLINPHNSAFDQTAGTIRQLLVHSDIQADIQLDNNKSDAYGGRIGRRASFYQLLFIYSSTKYNTLSISIDQGIVSAALSSCYESEDHSN